MAWALIAVVAALIVLVGDDAPALRAQTGVDPAAPTDVTLVATDTDHELTLSWTYTQSACPADRFALIFTQNVKTQNTYIVDSVHAGNAAIVPKQTATEESYSFTMTKLEAGVEWEGQVQASGPSEGAGSANCGTDPSADAAAASDATPTGTGTPDGRDPHVKGPGRPIVTLTPGDRQIKVDYRVEDDPNITGDDDVTHWAIGYGPEDCSTDPCTLGPETWIEQIPAATLTKTLTGLTNGLSYLISVLALKTLPTGGVGNESSYWQTDRADEARVPNPPPALSGAIADQALTQGASYTSATAFPAATAGVGSVGYSVASLPSGITLDTDRKLTGTATAPLAKTSLTYTASDFNDDTASLTFNISVAPKATTLAGAVGDTEAALTWTAIAGVDKWQVQQDTGSWTDIASSGAATASHTATGLTNHTAYSFKVRAVVGTGSNAVIGVASNSVSVTPDSLPALSGSIADQELTQGTSYTSGTAFPAATGGDGVISYAVASLPSGITLNSARKLTGTATAPLAKTSLTYTATDSDSSSPDSASLTFNISVAPKKPANFAGAAGGLTEVDLTWDAIAGVAKWQVKQDTGAWTDISGSGASTNSHTVTGLTYDTEYDFKVRAVVGTGSNAVNGAESDAVSVTTEAEDYDADGDGLIEVENLAQLNAIRWDLDGDGTPSSGNETTYAAAFPNAPAGMGCPTSGDPTGCIGYEITVDLDFDTDADGDLDAGDDYWNSGNGFKAIGRYTAILDGNGNAIKNLLIKHSDDQHIGLFAKLKGAVRDLGLEEVEIADVDNAHRYVGGVAGLAEDGSRIERVYIRGGAGVRSDYVFAVGHAGGLVGRHEGGVIARSYVTGITVKSKGGAGSSAGGVVGECNSTGVVTIEDVWTDAKVDGAGNNGGLVGRALTTPAHCVIKRSYAYGSVSDGRASGGLVGYDNDFSTNDGVTFTDSYWDKETTGQTADAYASSSLGKTTAVLRAPTSNTGIYANWSTDTWDFVHARHYPVLKTDWDGDGTATWQEFGDQPSTPGLTGPIAGQALTQGTAYTSAAAFPEGAHGDGALSYSVAGLPDGITLNSDRKLTGTATPPLAKTALTYKVVDGDSNTSDRDSSTLTFNISVAPKKPPGFSATAGDGEVRLGWTAIAGVSGWEVKQGTGAWAAIASSGAATTSHRVTGLTNGTAYSFKVRAFVGTGGARVNGVESDARSATPALSLPGAPASVTATAGDIQVALSWSAPTTGGAVAGYEVRWKTKAGSWPGDAPSGWFAAPGTSHTVTGLTNGVEHTFEVRAKNVSGAGPAASKDATPVDPAALAAPTGLTAKIDDGWTPTLSWTAPAGTINGYEYRHRRCQCDSNTAWSNAKALNGHGAWLYLTEPYTPPTSKEVLGLPAGVNSSAVATTSEVQLRAVSGQSVSHPAARLQRSDKIKGAWSASVSVSLMGSYYHRTPRAWAVSATPGYDEVTFGWTLPVNAADLEKFSHVPVQIAWWETADGVPDGKRWLNLTPYGELHVTGSETIEWWTPLTKFSYQVAYWMARVRFVQKDANGAEVTHTFTTLARPDYPPAPAVTVHAGNAKVLTCWTAVDAAPPVSRYEYRFFSLTAGTPKHANEEEWQTVSATAVFKEITGLTNGSVYVVQVRAVNSVGTSEYGWYDVTPVADAAAPSCS